MTLEETVAVYVMLIQLSLVFPSLLQSNDTPTYMHIQSTNQTLRQHVNQFTNKLD